MTTWDGNAWANLRQLVTTAGTFTSVYRPGAAGGEQVDILDPQGQHHLVHTPALHDWFLAAENGLVTVWYSQIVASGHQLQRIQTPIPCGTPAGATTTAATGPPGPAGPPGPVGPTGVDATAVRQIVHDEIASITPLIAAAASGVVENILLGPPAGDHYGLAPNARFGTRFQETIAVMFVNQAFLQEVVKALREAVSNLSAYDYDWTWLKPLLMQEDAGE